jgi:hypothetical protein
LIWRTPNRLTHGYRHGLMHLRGNPLAMLIYGGIHMLTSWLMANRVCDKCGRTYS